MELLVVCSFEVQEILNKLLHLELQEKRAFARFIYDTVDEIEALLKD